MAIILRLLALLGLLWTGKQVVNQVVSVFDPHRNGGEEKANSDIHDEMVRDPVCQTYIPKALAIKKTFQDKAVFFCSEECVAKFSEQTETDS